MLDAENAAAPADAQQVSTERRPTWAERIAAYAAADPANWRLHDRETVRRVFKEREGYRNPNPARCPVCSKRTLRVSCVPVQRVFLRCLTGCAFADIERGLGLADVAVPERTVAT